MQLETHLAGFRNFAEWETDEQIDSESVRIGGNNKREFHKHKRETHKRLIYLYKNHERSMT